MPQMKLIHTYPFIKPHDSAAIIKYAQLISTCVSVLHQYGFPGDLSSESVLNTALRKLPPELKTKWLFYAKGRGYQSANFSKVSEWLNEVAFVHDELLVQFTQGSDKKQAFLTTKPAQRDLQCLPHLMKPNSHLSMLTQKPLTSVLFVEIRMDYGHVMFSRRSTQPIVTKK